MIRLQGIAPLAVLLAACGSSHERKSCDPVGQTGCASGLACETVQNGAPACFAPVVVSGTVSNLVTPTDSTSVNLNGARVVALDPNQAPISKVAVTAGTAPDDGAYTLTVPAERDASGAPVPASFTLRVDRQDYEAFPSGVRVSLPIDLSSAVLDPASHTWKIASPLLHVKLLKRSGATGAFIHGTVPRPPSGAGALVVAEPATGGRGVTGVADADGSYAIFNLTQGVKYVVTAYTQGANYAPVTTAALPAGDTAVPLALHGGAGATFKGGLIYNNGAASPVAVSLVVQSTYVPTLDRGEAPPGLTVDGANDYAFVGVPDGIYVVLAAFGLDGDVRDVSGTGNTAAPVVTIAGGAVQGAPPNFKIIPAVELQTIDGTTVGAAPTPVTTVTPTFVWQRGSVDSSAGTYRVEVFDTYGNPIWSHDQAATAGQNSVAFDVDGTATAALQSGLSYQLRVLAIKEAVPVPATFGQLSQTEDVAGVFYVQ